MVGAGNESAGRNRRSMSLTAVLLDGRYFISRVSTGRAFDLALVE